MNKRPKSTVKPIPAKDLRIFVEIVANAYPGMAISTPGEKEKTVERFKKMSRDPLTNYYGVYRSGRLLGGMALYDFTMNYHSIDLPVGGVGLVATDLLHKKEHICKEMLQYFHVLFRRKKVTMTALYPFRPDFYKKMGYGYGAKMNQYYLKPADLPGRGGKANVQYLSPKDRPGIKACYERFRKAHHGLFTERASKWKFMFANPKVRIIGYRGKNKIAGYAVFSFKKVQDTNWIKHDLIIHDFVYETPSALNGQLHFLQSQLDQIHRIVFATPEDHFHHILADPRNGTDNVLALLAHETNVQGVGIMYRVIDTRRLFRLLSGHDFNGETCTVKLAIRDEFLPENSGTSVVRFNRGKPSVLNSRGHDVEVAMDVGDFSSLIMGVLDIRDLYTYGLVDVSKPQYLDVLSRLFHSPVKPITTTQF